MTVRLACVVFAVVGLVSFSEAVSPLRTLVVTVAVGLLVVCGYSAWLASEAGHREPRQRMWSLATLYVLSSGLIVMWACIGLAALMIRFPWSIPVLAAAVGIPAMAGLALRLWKRRRRSLDLVEIITESPARRAALVRAATDEELWLLWQSSGDEIRQAILPTSLTSYADLRRVLLDELESRDPDLVATWLADPSSDLPV